MMCQRRHTRFSSANYSKAITASCTLNLLVMMRTLLSVTAYTWNPTHRYLAEMGRLIRDPQLQRSSIGMMGVATPSIPAIDKEPSSMYEASMPYVRRPSDMVDYDVFDNEFSSHPSNVFEDAQTPSLASPYSDSDLSDALNRYIEALNEQIETSTTLKTALDYTYPSPELEYSSMDVETNILGTYSLSHIEQSYVDAPDESQILSRFHDTENSFRPVHPSIHFDTQHPTSIQQQRDLRTLPDSNDPYELLGLDYKNPPQDVDEIRRAYVKCAKMYHPDTIHPNANQEERRLASINFARINNAYRILKDEKTRLQSTYFATTLGGPMHQSRGSSRHIRRPYSQGHDFRDMGTIFSSPYSAKYGQKNDETRVRYETMKTETQRDWTHQQYGETKGSPFRSYQEVRNNCHVSGKEYPPFFSY